MNILVFFCLDGIFVGYFWGSRVSSMSKYEKMTGFTGGESTEGGWIISASKDEVDVLLEFTHLSQGVKSRSRCYKLLVKV